jgi:general stress protein YciG
MVGTRAGGLKTKAAILARDPNHYKKIGSKGGHNGRGPNYTGGFAGNKTLARLAGKIGGTISRRKGPSKK